MRQIENTVEEVAKSTAVVGAKLKELEARIATLEVAQTRVIVRREPQYSHATDVAENGRFPSLGIETRSHVDTSCASHWLGRRPQTLRTWACLENGPLRPVRINGRLAWPVQEIRRLLRHMDGERCDTKH